MRRTFALLVALLVSGLAPATVAIGFCVKRPCCVGEAAQSEVLAVDLSDCCTTISCSDEPSQDLAVSAKAKVLIASTLAMLPVAPALPQVSETLHTFDDTSPPLTTSERLSSLSVFRI